MIRIYVDFDGTITRRDVGDAMFARFGGPEAVAAVSDYRDGKLTAIECFEKECRACGIVDRAELDAFLDSCEIDGSFHAFATFASNAGMPVTVVSDGMDYYIKRILERNDLGTIPFVANHLDLKPAGDRGAIRMVPSFPHTDETCTRCACCKRNIMITESADDDVILVVGEGYSDRCPARYADLVFARDELSIYCRENGIPFTDYTLFADIQVILAGRMNRKQKRSPFRKRRQAELARREVLLGE